MNTAWIIGTIASILGISLGGGIAWFMKNIQRSLSIVYSICAGMIIGLLVLEMIPEAIKLGGFMVLILGISLGIVLFHYIHQQLNRISFLKRNYQRNFYMHSGLILSIGIAIHNFPVGISIGQTAGTEIGETLLHVLILHNIPEGIIIFTPIFLSGGKLFTWGIVTLFIALPMAIGSFLGSLINFDTLLLALLINIAIGVILMVTIKELCFEALKHAPFLYCLFYGVVGYGFIFLIDLLHLH